MVLAGELALCLSNLVKMKGKITRKSGIPLTWIIATQHFDQLCDNFHTIWQLSAGWNGEKRQFRSFPGTWKLSGYLSLIPTCLNAATTQAGRYNRMWIQLLGKDLLGPGLISIAERLQMSFSTWDMRSRVVWYESSVAQTVILSWMLPWPSRWSLPSLWESETRRERRFEGLSLQILWLGSINWQSVKHKYYRFLLKYKLGSLTCPHAFPLLH